MSAGRSEDSLTPAQRRVVVDLMAAGQRRPTFAPELSDQMRQRLDEELAPVLDRHPPIAHGTGAEPDPIWVNKTSLSNIHTCESHYVSEAEGPFEWNARNARGSVVHKALELAVCARGEQAPLALVDHAISNLMADDHRGTPGPWLRAASELELADLRARANDTVAKFFECWPPLKTAWAPRTETRIAAELCDGRVVLRGSVDVALGQARGNEARCLIVDLKTGRGYPSHLDDLRFYALVQVLRVGVPPFRVASYYLDSATYHAEDVTVETLEIAARRTVDGVRRIVELATGERRPALSPGPVCTWCRLRHDCEGGQAYQAALSRPDDGS